MCVHSYLVEYLFFDDSPVLTLTQIYFLYNFSLKWKCVLHIFSAGIDAAYISMLKEVCSKKKVNIQQNVLVHLMHLPDGMDLPTSIVVRYGQKTKVWHLFPVLELLY